MQEHRLICSLRLEGAIAGSENDQYSSRHCTGQLPYQFGAYSGHAPLFVQELVSAFASSKPKHYHSLVYAISIATIL